MSYFTNFPEIFYNFPIGGKEKIVVLRDITINFRILRKALENVTLYDEYDVVDGETPEIVSEKLYGTPKYHWVIMIANQRFDYVNDWVLPYDRLEQYCKDKYGTDAVYDTHHYEDANGFVVNSDYPMATPISNITVEERINESKRRIKIISKTVIQQITNEFAKLTK